MLLAKPLAKPSQYPADWPHRTKAPAPIIRAVDLNALYTQEHFHYIQIPIVHGEGQRTPPMDIYEAGVEEANNFGVVTAESPCQWCAAIQVRCINAFPIVYD